MAFTCKIHFPTPLLVPPRRTSVEFPYWWRVTTQIWVVLLIGCASTNQKHYPDLLSDTPSVWNFCACSSDVTFRGETSSCVAKLWLFSQAGIKQARACLVQCTDALATINHANTDIDGAIKSARTKGVSRIKRVESEKMWGIFFPGDKENCL